MHQLRTPLANLSMQVEMLSRMGRNVHRMRNLVDSILRLERFRPEEVPVRPEEVGAAQLVGAVMDDHVLDARRKGLRFEASVEPSLRVTLDPELFADALGNLVHNAVKFTDRGGVAVAVEPRNDEDDEIVFRVHDTGAGVAPDKQQALFEERMPGGAGGVGIGLQVARHAARAQGGDIELERSSEEGSVFALRLPRLVRPREARIFEYVGQGRTFESRSSSRHGGREGRAARRHAQ